MNRKAISAASVLICIITWAFFSGCKEEQPVGQPEFSWKGEQVVDGVFNAGPESGRYELEYLIASAVDGAQLSAETSDGEWISILDTKADAPAVLEGKLVFALTANEGAAREGRITLKYPDMSDQVLTVRQSAAGSQGTDFKITLGEVTLTGVEVKIVPLDEESTYLMFFAVEKQLQEDGLMEDDAKLVEADQAFLIQDGQAYGETLQETFDLYAKTGTFEEPMTGLMPATRYVLYVYGAKVENDRLVATTKVYRNQFETLDYEKTEVGFKFDYTIDGAVVNMTVTPENYDGYFFFDLLDGHQSPEEAEGKAAQLWFQLIDMFTAFGYDYPAILKEVGRKGASSFDYMLRGESPYTVYAFAINEECVPSSYVKSEHFTTGEIQPSDNQIDIQVPEIESRRARVVITPSNEDPYNAFIYASSQLEGMSADEIVETCLQMPTEPFIGAQDLPVDNLSPETEYSILCFGCVSGTATTELFRKDFTTLVAKEGTATVHVEWDAYYDIEEVGAIKPGFLDYLVAGDFFLPLLVVTDPADAEVFYYGIFCEEQMEDNGMETTDAAMVDALLARGPSEFKDDAYVLVYGQHYFIAALVEDAEGNLSKLWRSEVFSYEKEGASDPQDFLKDYGDLASVTSKMQAPLRESRSRTASAVRLR